MIKEAYCSFEVAKLLREKKFNESIFEYYVGNKDNIQYYVGNKDNIQYACNEDGFRPSELPDIYYPHITHQMACAWLREKGVFFCIHPDYPISKNYMVEFYDDGIPSGIFGAYEKYEDAVEAAIEYSLKNLI